MRNRIAGPTPSQLAQDIRSGIPELSPTQATFLGGAGAGLLGGTVFGAALGIEAGSLQPFRLIASAVLGPDALGGGAGAILVGIALHLLVAAVFGIVFAAFVDRDTARPSALSAGLLYSLALWAVMTYVAVPVFTPLFGRTLNLIGAWWLLDHLLYGATLLLTPELKWYSRAGDSQTPQAPAPLARDREAA